MVRTCYIKQYVGIRIDNGQRERFTWPGTPVRETHGHIYQVNGGRDMATTTVLHCGHPPSPHGEHTTGYGTSTQGENFCWDCCAKLDMAEMRRTGRINLYLTEDTAGKFSVGNWPGTLRIPVRYYQKGRHNLAGVRYDVWFTFDNATWHGVQYGNNTQIVHCKRTK